MMIMWTPSGVHQESIRSPSGVSGLYQESIRSLPGLYIFDLIILQEAHLPTNHMIYYELEISIYTYLLISIYIHPFIIIIIIIIIIITIIIILRFLCFVLLCFDNSLCVKKE